MWGGTYITSLSPLVILQKCFIRLICNRHRLEHTEQLSKSTGIMPIRNLYIFKVLIHFYIKSGNRNVIRIERKQTRQALNVNVPKPYLTLYKKFYSFLAPKLYNSLPDEIKKINTKDKFERLAKIFIQEHHNSELLFSTIS